MSDFRDIYYQAGENPVFCFRTGLTVYEEVFANGMLYSAGWNAAGYPLNVLGYCQTRLDPNAFARPEAFILDIDGESCNTGLKFISFEQEDGHAKVILRHSGKNIWIIVHTVLDGTPVIKRWLEIVNENHKSIAISRLGIMNGGVEQMDLRSYTSENIPESVYSIGYMDSADALYEGDFHWHALQTDETSFGGRFARQRHRFPMFALRNDLRGTILFGQMTYSGGYKFSFDYNAHPYKSSSNLAFTAEVDSYAPLYVLESGKTLTTPEMHIGMLHGDLDAAVNAMHEHSRKSILTLPEADASACLVGSGMGPEHDMTVETTKQFIDQMAAAGAEVFIIDAGWYCPPDKAGSDWAPRAGNWDYDKDRYPNGIEEVREYAHSKGLLFGMWMEVERMGKLCERFEAEREHFGTRRDGKQSEGFLDLSNPDVLAWCEEQAAHVIADYKLDLFRVDYNIDAKDLFHVKENDGYRECRAMRHTQGVYTLYNHLKKRFPKVIFENCASGGGRCDLGMLQNFNHSWVSDNQVPPRSALITNGMTMVIPPERVDRLVAGMGCHTIGSLAFHMRNAMFGHISMNVFGQKDCLMNPEIFGFIRHSLDLYKGFIRPFLPNCLVYHHTPDTKEILKNGYMILEDAARDRAKGIIGIFTMPNCAQQSFVLIPKGIDQGKNYRITLDNSGSTFTIPGYVLARDGIKVTVPSAIDSELVLYEAV